MSAFAFVPRGSRHKLGGRAPKRLPTLYAYAAFNAEGEIVHGPWLSTSEESARFNIDALNQSDSWTEYEVVMIGKVRVVK